MFNFMPYRLFPYKIQYVILDILSMVLYGFAHGFAVVLGRWSGQNLKGLPLAGIAEDAGRSKYRHTGLDPVSSKLLKCMDTGLRRHDGGIGQRHDGSVLVSLRAPRALREIMF